MLQRAIEENEEFFNKTNNSLFELLMSENFWFRIKIW